jgi:hypothetical protein
MLISHPLFDDTGRPLGHAVEDTGRSEFWFVPRGTEVPLRRRWRSLEGCRRAIIRMRADREVPA